VIAGPRRHFGDSSHDVFEDKVAGVARPRNNERGTKRKRARILLPLWLHVSAGSHQEGGGACHALGRQGGVGDDKLLDASKHYARRRVGKANAPEETRGHGGLRDVNESC